LLLIITDITSVILIKYCTHFGSATIEAAVCLTEDTLLASTFNYKPRVYHYLLCSYVQ